MSAWIFSLAARLPEAAWNTVVNEDCLLPYYHMVSDETVAHVSPLYRFRSIAEFEADLDFFLRTRRPISLADFLQSIRATQRPPPRSFLLTFDDGFREMNDIVTPILRRKGVPGVFFLNTCSLDNVALCHYQKVAVLLHHRHLCGTRFPDREVAELLKSGGVSRGSVPEALEDVPWLLSPLLDGVAGLAGFSFTDYLRTARPYVTSADVKNMLSQGMDIGAHSIDHPIYSDLTLPEQLHQTVESMSILTKRFGLAHRAFAFPHNDLGVSLDFFETVFREQVLDVSFGTSSPAIDCVPLNFQRFSMERTRLTAGAIVARDRLRRLKHRGNSRSRRPRWAEIAPGRTSLHAGTNRNTSSHADN